MAQRKEGRMGEWENGRMGEIPPLKGARGMYLMITADRSKKEFKETENC